MTARLLALGGAALLLAGIVAALWPGPEELAPLPQPSTARFAPPLAPEPAAAPAPVADLQGLVLAGVFGGAAIIEDSRSAQRVVRVGGTIAPGVRLAGVSARAATLESGGQLFRLELRRAGVQASATAISAAVPPPGASADALRYRLAFAPHKEGGQTTGFRLKDGPAPPVLAKAGLRPGDIVTMVNGQGFTSSEKVAELDQEIAGARTLAIDFVRDGKPRHVEAPLPPK